MWTRLRAIAVLGEGHHAPLGAVAVAEEVPELDPVAGGVEEVGGAVAPLVLDRAVDLDPARPQAGAQLLQAIVVDREREVDVAAAAVGVLLLAGGPDPKAAAVPGRQPDAVAFLQQQPQPELAVEARQAADVVGLQHQLTDSGHGHSRVSPLRRRFKPARVTALARPAPARSPAFTPAANGYPRRERTAKRGGTMSTIEESI